MEPTNQPEVSFEEGLRDVIQTLPAPIRNYLREKAYEQIVLRLTEKYKLHVDQAGVLEREIVLLLMGVKNPGEFAATLQNEGQIPQATMSPIMTDINEQIFAPLQQQMRTQGGGASKAPEQKAPMPITPAIAKATLPVPANLPGAPTNLLADHEEPHISIPNENQKPAAPAAPPMVVRTIRPAPATETIAPKSPLPQKYDTDPYREPFDDK